LSKAAGQLDQLRWRLTAMRRLWTRGTQPGQPFVEIDRVLREPDGNIDLPEGDSPVGPILDVQGWALFPEVPTARVEVSLSGRSLGRARLGHPRPDVAARWHPEHAGSSGFQLTESLADLGVAAGEAEIEVVATSLDGDRLRLEPVAVEIDPRPEKKRGKMPPPRLRTPLQSSSTRPHVMAVTHQLNLGGAQLYLLDLLREMVAGDLASFTLVSTMDGELRKDVEALGIPVHLTSPTDLSDIGSHIGRLEEMISWMSGREFDAVLVNTATLLATPGAEAAAAVGLPVLWAIHESFPPSQLWVDIAPEVEEKIAAAMAGSAALVFEAEATQRLYEPVAGAERCHTIPYGLDFTPIDSARRGFDGAEARREEGIPADAELVVCIGTIEPRKAQLMLAEAFELIARRHPSAHLAFVGGRDDFHTETLQEYIDRFEAGDRIKLIPITPDVDRWYGMADLYVSASDIESLPRTVLEAMAWETPVLATDVFGLPELITDGETGWLCEPRDLRALADGLERALSSSPEERREIGRRSRALVQERHSLPNYAQRISRLLQDALAR
jgi:D-inositol-3-phosphate glycosyltransferase